MRFTVPAFLFLLSLPATAHIQLDVPLVRYSNASGEINKRCPCGSGAGTSSCGGTVLSDPNRSATRVTTYAPGETITVQWRETVGHTGRYRIAFDNDGADLADFNAHILADIADPSGGTGNTGNGNRWSTTVTLPTTPCTTCTLQLLQVMSGNTATPVASPVGTSTYFQCADIVIAAPVGEGEGEGEGEPGEGEGEPGEGEGEPAEGEGEPAEGEGEPAEGEGEGEAAEGEGEGETVEDGCVQGGMALSPAVLLLGLLRRRRAA